MRLSQIKETASAGATGAGAICTNLAGGTPPKGQFFGGDPASSIYTTIKKHRKERKAAIVKEGIPVGSNLKNWLIRNEKTGKFWNGKVFGGWTDRSNAELFSSDQHAFELPRYGKWVDLESLYWAVAKKLYTEYSKDITDEKTDTPAIYKLALENGCSKDEGWEVVESFFKMLRKWGPAIVHPSLTKKLRVSEAAKTAKPPAKPSGKAEVIGSTKPYKQPGVLSPTMKVKSTGKMLGGSEKKNPTLSTKFFGTCSATNDPGNKAILDEVSPKITTQHSFDDLKNLKYGNGAAFITPNNNVYIGKNHAEMRTWLAKHHINCDLEAGAVRIRYSGTQGFDGTQIHIRKHDAATLTRAFKAMEYINNPANHPEFELVYDGDEMPQKLFIGSLMKIKKKVQKWLKPETPHYSSVMNYWRSNESKVNRVGNVLIELTYREFRNASNAISKICPGCSAPFKNIHDVNQKFCSKDCEGIGSVNLKLKEAWDKIWEQFETKDGKIIDVKTVRDLVKRVMDDSGGQMGRLQACLFVAGMLKNCTGWTVHFALEDLAKKEAAEMYKEK